MLEIDLRFFAGQHFDTISKEHPTGHMNLQKKRDLNHETTRITNPIKLSVTRDLETITEFNCKKGLNQFEKPVSFPKLNGNANKMATPNKKILIEFLLSKIYILISQLPGQFFDINIPYFFPLFY